MMVNSLAIKKQAIDIADSLGATPEMQGFLHSKKGNLHLYMENYQSALEDYIKADSFYMQMDVIDYTIVSSTNNIGICYTQLEDFDKAISYFEKTIELAKKSEMQAWRREAWDGIASGNIGNVYFKRKEYEKAIPLLIKDIETSKKQNVHLSHMLSLNRLGTAYIETGKVEAGKILLDSAMRVFQMHRTYFFRAGFPEKQIQIRLGNLKGNIAYYQKKQVFDTAFTLSERYNFLTDSLNDMKRKQSLTWIEAQMKIKEKEKAFKSLQSAVKQQGLLLYLGGGIILALLVAVIAIWKGYQSNLIARQQASKLLEAELRERNERERKKKAEEFAKSEISRLERSRLQEELEHKQRELVTYTHRLVEKNELLQNVLKQIAPKESLSNGEKVELEQLIKQELNHGIDWDSYKKAFEKVHPQFFKSLIAEYPKLTQNDLRYAAYVKMGLSSKEIATILNVNADSLKNTRYRMKQKMGFSSNTKINDFIVAFQR